MSKKMSNQNNQANQANSNQGTTGTNKQNAKVNGNRGKQMNPNRGVKKK